MQASKIFPKKVYAIKRDDRLVRFYVDAVVTRRTTAHGNPHDYKSTVEGFVTEDAMPDNEEGAERKRLQFDADRILGPFEDYQELVARRDAEKLARDQEADARKAAALDLWALLYDKTGTPRPNDPSSYKQPFQARYASQVELNEEGIKLLTGYLRNH